MNILQVNEKSGSGGAAVAMLRLHDALLSAGHASQVLVARQARAASHHVLQPPSLLDRIGFHAVNLAGMNFAGLGGLRRFIKTPCFPGADIVHFHNLHGGYFNYRWLPEISRIRPVVWTLHDMWALAGHCAYTLDCSRWRTGCGRCPHPETYPAIRRDATHWEWRLKQTVYRRSDIVVVCPSKWLAALAHESPLIPFPVHHVSNGVDTEIFRPRDKAASRNALGLPQDKVTMVFVADNLNNPFKNFGMLVAALQGLEPAEKSRFCLLLLGGGSLAPDTFQGFTVKACGYVDDDLRKAGLLSAADFMVFPTKADNQPLVIIEAMACGCPVVSTAVGGIPEMVLHEKTGLLVDHQSPEDFRAAIRSMVNDTHRLASFSAQSRNLAVQNHSLSSCAAQHIALYQDTVREWKGRHAT